MAHFAQIDENNIVQQVIVISDNDAPNEVAGQTFINKKLKLPGVWLQTSYNTSGGKHLNGGVPLRLNYAGIGYIYDEQLDGFIPPKPYNSWMLNTETGLWEPPIAYPDDGNMYKWDESSLSWVIQE